MAEPSQHQINGGACLKCGAPMTGATNVTGATGPAPGDVTVCLYCGHLMEFAADLKLIEPSEATIKEVAGHPELLRAMTITNLWRQEQSE